MTKATWNGAVIAVSESTVLVEGNHYFPPDAVNRDFLKPSRTSSNCPWKGEASYYTLDVEGKQNEDAAWYYADPKKEAENIKDHVAFWKGVEITG